MKPTVWNSYEDDTGARCVDILKHDDGSWSWVECRRDPEDSRGWSTLGDEKAGFSDEAAAMNDALASVGWLKAPREG